MNEPQPNCEGLLTYDEVAARLNVSSRQVRRLKKAKAIKFVALGGRIVRFRPADVDRFISRRAGDQYFGL